MIPFNKNIDFPLINRIDQYLLKPFSIVNIFIYFIRAVDDMIKTLLPFHCPLIIDAVFACLLLLLLCYVIVAPSSIHSAAITVAANKTILLFKRLCGECSHTTPLAAVPVSSMPHFKCIIFPKDWALVIQYGICILIH